MKLSLKNKPAKIDTGAILVPGNRPQSGFSLIELMVAVVIVAVLASLALPAYTGYVTRSNRVAAQAEMGAIASRQGQYFAARRQYAGTAELSASGYALPTSLSSHYEWAVTADNTGLPTYTITFTPVGSQASDPVLTLNSEGVKTPADKWS